MKINYKSKWKINIGTKLLFSYGLILICMIGLGVFSFVMLEKVHNLDGREVENWQMVNFISEKETDHLNWVSELNNSILLGEDFSGELDPRECDFGKAYFELLRSEEFNMLPAEIKETFRNIERPHELLHRSAVRINDIDNQYGLDTERGTGMALDIYQTDTLRNLQEVQNLFGKYKNHLEEQSSLIKEEVDSDIAGIKRRIILFIGLTVVLTIIIIIIFVRHITKPLKMAVDFSNDIANGNLKDDKIVLNRKDEFGRLINALNTMKDNLRSMIWKISNTAQQVAASSEELSASGNQVGTAAEQVGHAIQEVASGAEEQSAQIEETSKMVEELIDTVNNVGKNTSDLANDGKDVMENINRGRESVNEVNDKIDSVKEDALEVSKLIKSLGKTSNKIINIVGLINSMAEQTNLLALNAAIEAARAGEAGRGFSVVADEIRELAEESSDATGKISGLITSIQNDVTRVIEKVNESTDSVEDSVGASRRVDSAFVAIEGTAKKLQQTLIKTTEQAKMMAGISDEVSIIIQNVASVSQEAASQSEEVAASSEEQIAATEEIVDSSRQLAEMADELSVEVSKFDL